MRALALALGCVLALPAAPPADRLQAFRATFHRLCEAHRLVGASVLLLDGDRELLREDHGLQDRAAGTPVDRATAFHWASLTKTFTAVAILQARDRGLLGLDDPITKYLPELRKVHNPYGSMDAVTLRHLLTHSAGFRAPTWPWRKGAAWEPFEPTEWSQLVAMLPYTEVAFAPGTKFSYSNPGYIFLARVLEVVTGDPFVEHVEKNLLRPLGLAGTYFDRAPYLLLAHRSHSYTWTAQGLREEPFDFHTGITVGNGGLNGPLTDLGRWVAFLMGRRGPAVLGATSLAEAFQPVLPAGSYQRTLGFFRKRSGGTDWVTHTGSQNGFLSLIAFDPPTGRALLLAFNTDRDWPEGQEPAEGLAPPPPMDELLRRFEELEPGS